MRTQTLTALVFGLTFLAGCSDSSSKFKGDFLAGCMDSGSSKAFCTCMVEKIDVQYSPAELSKMNNTRQFPQGFTRFIVAAREACHITAQ